jgi:hypothetical protein
MAQTVRVKGLADLLRVTDAMPKETKKGVRDALRRVAEPVRDEATARFLTSVSSDVRKTRYGISVRKVGTVTVEQRKKRTTGKHPEFARVQMTEALEPALAHNVDLAVREMDAVLADLERKWGRR